ncbi:LysR [Desulforapulum autotrophicum HRM2]|uniref:LysR n=1 Tax=Desulforapulum autotrophicum (strain ATCC 43914 / DSM 3382 / VKM B-1955 / HRM2) TaxID=177437 RepID=C0QLD9_DESAH|nr:selenium metabolism-associated LysR family transcriptional regulator [Desulforapulum autotrophicum]ACN14225.1 LysR [Desulforapulum autotrophicum HRM2]
MDLWQLRVFVNVVEQQSFSKAGEVIHLSQPTVSSHIKELEEYFECRLMDRMGRNTVPTKAGELLFSYAKRLLRLRDETESAISDFLGKRKGHLVIGGSTIPSGYILPAMIAPIAQAFPEVSLSFVAGDTAEIINQITKGDIEVGIVGARVKSPLVAQEKLVDDEMKLIVASSHKWSDRSSVTPDMLLTEPFLAREEGSGTWRSITRNMEEAGLNTKALRIIATMGNTASMIQAILGNAGISILSTIAVADLLASGRLKALTVEGLDLKRSFYITTHGKRTLSPLSKTFIKFLKERFPEL